MSCRSGSIPWLFPDDTSVEVATLPQKWFRVPNGTPPELERFVDRPWELKEYVEGILRRAQPYEEAEIGLIDVYFEVGRPVAHVLVRNLDDPINVKAFCRILHVEGYRELLMADQMRTAIEEREQAMRPEPGSTSTS
jgi:hypothetical protein